jgi:hypothetical protein
MKATFKAEAKANSAAPSIAAARVGVLQRKCACGATPGLTGECAECGKKKLSLQRRATLSLHRGEGWSEGQVPPIVHEVLRAPGRPLDPATRAFFEPRFGHDFSQVRIHIGAQAAESARTVNALAYTVGSDIVFDDGLFHPGTLAGKHLLAHELTHAVQQRSARFPDEESDEEVVIGDPSDRSEKEADAIADRVLLSESRASGFERPTLSMTEPVLARTDCSRLRYRDCITGVYKCGYGGSGTCGWVGPTRGGCICVGAARPPLQRVLEVLLIIGISITLLATVIAALLDPEPVTKLGLAGLSAAQITLLLTLLGYEEPGESGPTATVGAATEEPVA